MSLCATQWAWSLNKQQVSSLEKLVLLSLADRADEKMECFPSGKRLEKDCNTDIKTIYKALESLIKKGIIKKTGEMKGRTKSVPVYRLIKVQAREDESIPKNGNAYSEAYPKTDKLSVPKNGYKNLSLESKEVRTHARTLFEQYKITIPVEEDQLSVDVIAIGITTLKAHNFTLESYLDLLVLHCSNWVYEPWQTDKGQWRMNSYEIIMKPINIKKAINGEFRNKNK